MLVVIRYTLLILLYNVLIHCTVSYSQNKKPFTFEDAMKFKYIERPELSDDGNWVGYVVSQDRGDGELIIQSTVDTTKFRIERGSKYIISRNSEWIAAKVESKSFELENAKDAKTKPKSGLAILNIKNGKKVHLENIKDFEISNDSKWLIYFIASEKLEIDKEEVKKNKKKATGDELVLRHLRSGTEIKVSNVTEYQLDSLSRYIFYIVSEKSGKRDGVYNRNLMAEYCPEEQVYVQENYHFSNLAWNYKKGYLAFLSSSLNEEGEPYRCSLWNWSFDNKSLNSVMTAESVRKNWYIPVKNELKWTEDGDRLFFGLKPEWERYSLSEEKINYSETNYSNIDTILRKAEVDIWNSQDDLIMPHQKISWSERKDRFYRTLYRLDSNKVIYLADTSLPRVDFTDNPNYTVGYSDKLYLKEISWDGIYYDLYSLNLNTGERKKIISRINEEASLSPFGKYIVYFNSKHWYLYSTFGDTLRNLTIDTDVPFYDEENDTPTEPLSYGVGGWEDNDEAVYINDRYDIWKFYTGLLGYSNITVGLGREEEVVMRIWDIISDKKYYNERDTIFIKAFSEKTKTTGLYYHETWILGILRIYHSGDKLNVLRKSKNANQMLVTFESYAQYPDLHLSDLFMTNIRRITDYNSQIKGYNWGKTEFIKWKNSSGVELEGFIIKPENYKEGTRYPVIIYFYEKFSDYLNNFFLPRINHRPCFPIYSSDGYIIFLPDIKYTIGYPGFDATDALVSGARKLIELGIADSNAIGIHGHSWGGYETAFIITQTNLFKAAIAGAPVGNMTSAYSGIRRGTGLARQFQYEKEQSRIGGTLWDSLDNYIKNSPVFNAKGITTPFLMMFGDEDEAVPFEQGIELYLAMRRLNKQCIFLQYRKEMHHPRRYENKLDYATKMKQFFDCYLKGMPAPDWILKAVPYKGK